jgi:hypothetical protein
VFLAVYEKMIILGLKKPANTSNVVAGFIIVV